MKLKELIKRLLPGRLNEYKELNGKLSVGREKPRMYCIKNIRPITKIKTDNILTPWLIKGFLLRFKIKTKKPHIMIKNAVMNLEGGELKISPVRILMPVNHPKITINPIKITSMDSIWDTFFEIIILLR